MSEFRVAFGGHVPSRESWVAFVTTPDGTETRVRAHPIKYGPGVRLRCDEHGQVGQEECVHVDLADAAAFWLTHVQQDQTTEKEQAS